MQFGGDRLSVCLEQALGLHRVHRKAIHCSRDVYAHGSSMPAGCSHDAGRLFSRYLHMPLCLQHWLKPTHRGPCMHDERGVSLRSWARRTPVREYVTHAYSQRRGNTHACFPIAGGHAEKVTVRPKSLLRPAQAGLWRAKMSPRTPGQGACVIRESNPGLCRGRTLFYH